MYAITFDIKIEALRKHYGEPYNNVYNEVRKILRPFGFEGIQGSVYVSTEHNMANLFAAMNALRSTEWFRRSVRV